MSVKPDDIPRDVWGDAVKVVYAGRGRISTRDNPTFERVARAIMAAEKRGEEREREGAARIIEAESARILSKQDGKDKAVDDNLRLMACILPVLADTIRKRQSKLG